VIALDTNVIVRVVTQGDRRQARAAVAVMRSGAFFVAKTVLVEVAWVLARAYGLERDAVGHALRTLIGVESAVIEDRSAVLRALAWHEAGLDFAEAMHVASAAEASALVTLDRRFARSAARLDTSPPVRLPGDAMPEAVGERRGRRYGRRASSKRKQATRGDS
jgi:predicted nucleic-acid-binding protein